MSGCQPALLAPLRPACHCVRPQVYYSQEQFIYHTLSGQRVVVDQQGRSYAQGRLYAELVC
ncbi:MAG: hypothetical protein ACJ8DI_34940, partial [Ktedonobacteraceae bacterium]